MKQQPKQLTPNQRQALHWMSKKALFYCVAGFSSELRPLQYWSSQTVLSLEARGLCTHRRKRDEAHREYHA